MVLSTRRFWVHGRNFQSWSASREEVRFQFRCTGCGKCCTGRGGHVRVNDREVAELAAFTKSTVNEFKRNFTRSMDKDNDEQKNTQLVLKQTPDDYQCIFLKGSKCSVYPARPTQCRTFPWWPQHLASQFDWQLAANSCEGIIAKQEDMLEDIPVYTFDDVIPETILHDIHSSGENFTYDELRILLRDLREVEPEFIDHYKAELFDKFSRQIVYYDDEITVLDSFFEGKTKVTRSYVFNDRLHLTQSEVPLCKVPSESAPEFDRSMLALDIHKVLCLPFAWLPKQKDRASPIRVAVLGAGACTLPLFLLEHHSSKELMQLDAVEPWKSVNEVARRFFGVQAALNVDSRLVIHEETGEDFVTKELDHTFDLVVIDVECGQSCDGVRAPPLIMLDASFLERVRCLLVPNGILAINVITETEMALKSVQAKIEHVFSRRLQISLPTNTALFLFNEKGNANSPLDVADYVQLVHESVFQIRHAQTPALLKKSQLKAW